MLIKNIHYTKIQPLQGSMIKLAKNSVGRQTFSFYYKAYIWTTHRTSVFPYIKYCNNYSKNLFPIFFLSNLYKYPFGPRKNLPFQKKKKKKITSLLNLQFLFLNFSNMPPVSVSVESLTLCLAFPSLSKFNPHCVCVTE